MVKIKRLETIQIEAKTLAEAKASIDYYVGLGYELEDDIFISDDRNDEYPIFAYVHRDEFKS